MSEDGSKLNTVSRDEFRARIDPWLRAGRLSRPVRSGLEAGLTGIPRLTDRLIREFAVGTAVLTGIVSGLFILPATNAVGNLRTALATGDVPDLLLSALGAAAGVGLTFIIAVQAYRFRSNSLRESWEAVYADVYLRLAETNLLTLLPDDEFWREQMDHHAAESLFKLVGFGPPKTIPERVRFFAVFWMQLIQLQEGDRDALRRSMVVGWNTYRALGPRLASNDTEKMLEVRARAAAIVDFLIDPPEVLPPYRDPSPYIEVSRAALESYTEAFGYDYRIRAGKDRNPDVR